MFTPEPRQAKSLLVAKSPCGTDFSLSALLGLVSVARDCPKGGLPLLSAASRVIGTHLLFRVVLLTLAHSPALAQAPDAHVNAARVNDLLHQMTLEEKLSLVHGTRDPKDLGQAGYWPGLPRLGIPPLRFADGPPGINVNREATALPAPVALAAAFDTEAARIYGIVMGRDAAALEQTVVLAPHVNIVRDPLFRRNHTAFSEDPLLSAMIGAAEIRGIQSQGVLAQVKHVAGYNGAQNVAIDERTLHEVYLRPFAAAIEAGVASAMCAYNQINGEWACENEVLQNGLLRGELRFSGFITSDWGAVHSPSAITRGLDLEMPGREIGGRRGGPYFTDALETAVGNGVIPVADVDHAVGRILQQMARFGLLDRKPAGPREIDVVADAKIVRTIAAAGAVLLQNRANALPLTQSDLDSIVLIGPTAGQLASGYLGERAYGFASRLVSPVAALRRTVPTAHIVYSPGVDLTGSPILTSGLVRRRVGDSSHERHPNETKPNERHVDTILDFHGATALEANADYAWSGTLNIEEEGDYTFLVQPALGNGSEGGGSILIDGQRAARTGGPGFGGTGMVPRKWSGIIPTTDGRDNGIGAAQHLTAGQHRIELTSNSTGDGTLSIRFAWITPGARRAAIEAAVGQARRSQTAIVFAWCGAGSVELPENQDELITRVAAVARKTIVVLNTGGPVQMPWKEKVSAILEMWYPGQEGGWATADVLLGRVNPGGRLPVTFPRRLEDTAPYAPGHPERRAPQLAPGTGGTNTNAPLVTYSEGVAVGYRWFDQEEIEPLFPFGHGLSYTRFEYSRLVLKRNGDGLDATVRLRNTGRVRGSEVVQLYLGPGAGPPMPPRSLAAFARVELEAGASRTLILHVDWPALSYWSSERHQWITAAGGRSVYIGASSRDIRLSGVCGPRHSQ